MTTLNVRIEEKTKAQATKTLAKLGLDMSSAVKLFLTQVIKEDGLPFTPTNNPKAIRARWDKQVADALKHGKRYSSAKEMHDDILR
jgi:DNA-damage-inducible protein J